jgi:hypothetical protein
MQLYITRLRMRFKNCSIRGEQFFTILKSHTSKLGKHKHTTKPSINLDFILERYYIFDYMIMGEIYINIGVMIELLLY